MRGFFQTDLTFFLIVFAAGFSIGGLTAYEMTSDHYKAAGLEAEREASRMYRSEVSRGNELANRLVRTEQQLMTHVTEVVRNVPKVTTGRKCLDAAAVRLLNGEPAPKLSQTAVQPDAEGADEAAATDTDVAYWIAASERHYEICAGRLNGLIEFEEGRP